MTRREFEKEYGLSRRQVDRLVAEAREGDGTFEIPDRGRFQVRKGKGKTDPLEIATVSTRRVQPSLIPAPRQADPLDHLSKAELEAELLKANIVKTRQQAEAERQRIRAEALAEAEAEMVRRFAGFRQAMELANLTPEQLKILREGMDGNGGCE